MDIETMGQIRGIIETNPSRHDQSVYLDNVFAGLRNISGPAGELRKYAFEPVPVNPVEDSLACGTTGCVAGWVAILKAPLDAIITGYYVQFPGSRREDKIHIFAQRELGLSSEQADYLFSGGRTRDEVLAALAYLPGNQDATFAELCEACGNDSGQWDNDEDED